MDCCFSYSVKYVNSYSGYAEKFVTLYPKRSASAYVEQRVEGVAPPLAMT